jgi:hypothetical protein
MLLPQSGQFTFITSFNAPQLIKGISLRAALPPGHVQTISATVCAGDIKRIATPPWLLCLHPHCENAQAKLTGGISESWLELDFPKPLATVHDYHAMTITLTQSAGAPVSIWTGKDKWTYTAPDVRLLAAKPEDDFAQVFNDGIVAVYELNDAAPYVKTNDPRCKLQIVNRTHMRTQCPAPAQLTRLEMFDPGWTASVNGVDKSVTVADGRFQSVLLPAGAANVIFNYQPPHIFLAWMLALAAALVSLGLAMAEMLRARRGS